MRKTSTENGHVLGPIGISQAMSDIKLLMFDFPTQKKLLEPILRHSSNHTCADCDTRSPTWASLDFGVFLCSNCSGAHRALGPTITRVKSANLDLWQEEWLAAMVLGNEQINAYWEADPAFKARKPTMGASPEEIRRYVFEKYVKKRFVTDPDEEDPLAVFKKRAPEKQEKREAGGSSEDKTSTPELQGEGREQSSQNQKNGSPSSPKGELSLLDFDVELHPPPHNEPEAPEVELTSHTERGTSFTSETSKENFVDFNTLLQAQRQQQPGSLGQGQLHHSFSTQAVLQHNSMSPPLLPPGQQPFGFPQGSNQGNLHQNNFQHPHTHPAHHSPQSHTTPSVQASQNFWQI